MVYTEVPVIQSDNAANRQIIFLPQIFCLVVGAIFALSGQIEAVALSPQLLRFCYPLSTQKASHLDFSQRIFLRQQIRAQNFLYSDCIFVIEQKISAQFKANQGIGVLLFQSIVFGSGITIQHWELSFRFLHGGTMLFFFIGQVAVRLNHQVDVFLDLCPA